MPFDIVVKKNATVDDTLQLIIHAINVCSRSPFVQAVVREISQLHNPQTDPHGFIRELHDWCRRNGKYKLDVPGIEEVWTPELTTRMRQFDCKKITVLCCAVLQAAGLDPIPKHVYYTGPNGELEQFTHIYTIVPASSLGGVGIEPYITVDPTNDAGYNHEVQHSKATLYPLNGQKMELHMMGRAANIPDNGTQQSIPRPAFNTSNFSAAVHHCATRQEDTMRSICNMPATSLCGPADYKLVGLTAKDGNKILFEYTAAQAAAHAAKVLVYTPVRAAFLGLIYLGKFAAKVTGLKLNLGLRLAAAWQRNPSAMRKQWWLLGGEKTASALRTAIMKASGVSISGPYGYGYDYPGLFRPGMNGTTIGEPVTLATATAALAVATPAVVAFKALMKQLGVFKDGDTDPEPAPTEVPPTPPPTPGPTPGPSAGSLATGTIDNWYDALNWIKGSLVIMMGAAAHPKLIVPTQIGIVLSLIYALRKQLFYKWIPATSKKA